jgi:hypothetical protein
MSDASDFESMSTLVEAVSERLREVIAVYWKDIEVDSPRTVLTRIQALYAAFAFETGRLEGAARLLGVSRSTTLEVLRQSVDQGKRAALRTHQEQNSKCECQASSILEAELRLDS